MNAAHLAQRRQLDHRQDDQEQHQQ